MDRFKKLCKALFWPSQAVTILLAPVCAVLLFWVFYSGYQETLVAYPIYVLSAYALSIGCIALIPAIRRRIASGRKKKASLTEADRKKQIRTSLYQSLGINLIYAVFKIVSGIVYRSAWLWSSGLYYMVLSLIRFILVLYERRINRIEDPLRQKLLGWDGFRSCGFLLLLLNLTMSGMVFQMIWQDTASSYPEIVVIAIAAYTFYRLSVAIIQVYQSRKQKTPIQGAARNISLTAAMMSLFSLQTALFSTYGEDFTQQFLMNSLTGGAVCLLAVLGALGMVVHGSRRKKEIIGEK